MKTRLQIINGDRMIEITEDTPRKRLVSENRQMERKAYLEAAIGKFQAELDECNAYLAMINTKATEYAKAR